jgi:hypothetical protein
MKKLILLTFLTIALIATAVDVFSQKGCHVAPGNTLDTGYDSLTVNNINALFNAGGSHFFFENAHFEVPKYSGKSTIFLNALWLGGFDGNQALHLAGQRYGQGPSVGAANTCHDWYAGPVMDSSAYSAHTDSVWNYIWNLTKADIEYHKANWNTGGYQPIHDILTWPGNGNTALGQAAQLAPYFDQNGDGIYNPYDGDYPLIRGDQALFFIFNDDRNAHSETYGVPMKVEVHGMAYAFDMPQDSAFSNTVFLRYQVFNRSQNNYSGTWLGLFNDFDIGYAVDDYIGCDVQRGSCIGYNGTPVDGSGQPNAYGSHPPAQSMTILGGPLMDPDGIDNPAKDSTGKQLCNASVNGMGFGDRIVDNERFGMTRFMMFNIASGGFPAYMQDPHYAVDYYHYLQGIWLDGTHMIYGGNGNATTGGYGPECSFMFPGTTDSLNWGCGCQPPNGVWNWTEAMVGNAPGDRRGMASMGPFTFHPGDEQDVDVSFSFARDYTGTPYDSVIKLDSIIDIIRTSYMTNTLPNGESFNAAGNIINRPVDRITLYPNPAAGIVTLDLHRRVNGRVSIGILNARGMTVSMREASLSGTTATLDLSSLPAGLYLVSVKGKDFSATAKLSVVR